MDATPPCTISTASIVGWKCGLDEFERWNDAAHGETRIVAKVGRNDPCPCGSGRRHKRCCGA